MTRIGSSLPSPIKGRLKRLAMGSDSDGPLLSVWSSESTSGSTDQARFSFIDPGSLKVLRAGSIRNGGMQGIGSVSPSRGTITLHPFLQNGVHVRASAGGDLYAIWPPQTGFQTLAVRGNALTGFYNHVALDSLVPGPDGDTIFTGRGSVLDASGKPCAGPILERPLRPS
jgi:hypothetical protein